MEDKIVYEYEDRYKVLEKLINKLLNKLYSVSYPKPKIEFTSIAKIGDLLNKGNGKYKFPIDFYYLPKNVYDEIIKDFMETHGIKLGWNENMDFLIKILFKEGGMNEVCTPTKWSDGKPVRHCEDVPTLDKIIPKEYSDKVKEILENYKRTYKFDNRDYNSFYFSVMNYSPSSNKETVEKAWKEVYNKDVKVPSDDTWIDSYSYADENE